MDVFHKLADRGARIKFETQQDRNEFLEWYIENGGESDEGRHKIQYLHYDKYCLWLSRGKYVFCDWNKSDDYCQPWQELKLEYRIGGNEMNFNLRGLTTRYVVKLRNNNICFIGDTYVDRTLYTKECFGKVTDGIWLNNFRDSSIIKHDENEAYDIVAIKKYETTPEAYYAVLNDEVTNWDWEYQELTPEQLELKKLEQQQNRIADKMSELSERIGGLK